MKLEYLEDLWDETETKDLDELELLRYRSNLLGRDLRLTNFGGGNTSAKIEMSDPVTGEKVETLWVKGSGGDLGTIKRDGFASLYMEKLLALKRRYRGVEHEDEMPDLYPLCAFGANPRAASIDTPLHAFLPFRHVDHLHPDWAISLAACANGPEQLARLRRETGLHLIWLPWKRPGFELGLWLEIAVKENPEADGIILGSHGLFTWGDTNRECYLNTLRVIDGIGRYLLPRIEAIGDGLFGGQRVTARLDKETIASSILPALRGMTEGNICHFDCSEASLRFINSVRAQALAWQGTSCPDHFVRTRVRPLYVEWEALHGDSHSLLSSIREGLIQYGMEYAQYYEENRLPDSPPMRGRNPTVMLVPGVGMFSFGKSKSEARRTSEFYINAIHVMEGATVLNDLPSESGASKERVVDNYAALPLREAFHIEYWLLEEAKLKRMPPEKELSRKVALVVGASPGIGYAVADRLCKEGAHVVIADINESLAKQTAGSLKTRYEDDYAEGFKVDCTNRESTAGLMRQISLLYGGVDILVVIAAIFFPPDGQGRISDEQWQKTFNINLLGSMIAADEAQKIMADQGMEGAIVLISSANGVVAKKGSWAYDSSKAGLNHLIREMAVEFAPKVRVNGVAPASVVEGSQQFPRQRLISSLNKYSIEWQEEMSDEELSGLLADFYAQRTLLKKRVTPKDVADAVFTLASSHAKLTTGQILAVDAGLPEAFTR